MRKAESFAIQSGTVSFGTSSGNLFGTVSFGTEDRTLCLSLDDGTPGKPNRFLLSLSFEWLLKCISAPTAREKLKSEPIPCFPSTVTCASDSILRISRADSFCVYHPRCSVEHIPNRFLSAEMCAAKLYFRDTFDTGRCCREGPVKYKTGNFQTDSFFFFRGENLLKLRHSFGFTAPA